MYMYNIDTDGYTENDGHEDHDGHDVVATDEGGGRKEDDDHEHEAGAHHRHGVQHAGQQVDEPNCT